MDKESQQRFDQLAAVEPAAWTDADKAFMRARASYMTEDQIVKFADVLGNVPAAPADVPPAADEAPSKPKRGKKDE
jgi:hypothetical protein